jgi:hypothetical protein
MPVTGQAFDDTVLAARYFALGNHISDEANIGQARRRAPLEALRPRAFPGI